MELAVYFIGALALMLQLHHSHRHRAATTQARHATLKRRLTAVETTLPSIEERYGVDSRSARYLRAASYLTRRQLARLTPRNQTSPHGSHPMRHPATLTTLILTVLALALAALTNHAQAASAISGSASHALTTAPPTLGPQVTPSPINAPHAPGSHSAHLGAFPAPGRLGRRIRLTPNTLLPWDRRPRRRARHQA